MEAEDGMTNFVAFIAHVILKLSHLDIYSTLFFQPKKVYITRNYNKLPYFNFFFFFILLLPVIKRNNLDLNILNWILKFH